MIWRKRINNLEEKILEQARQIQDLLNPSAAPEKTPAFRRYAVMQPNYSYKYDSRSWQLTLDYLTEAQADKIFGKYHHVPFGDPIEVWMTP